MNGVSIERHTVNQAALLLHILSTHTDTSVRSQVHKFCSVISHWSRSMIILCFTGRHANRVDDRMCDSIFFFGVFAINIIINLFVCPHKGLVLSCSRLVLSEGFNLGINSSFTWSCLDLRQRGLWILYKTKSRP